MDKTSFPYNPTTSSERVESLDILRGFAILGILIMNIQSFSMVGAAYVNPTAFGSLTGINRVVWMLSHIIADQKFMPIFAMLFGAGIVLMSQRFATEGKPVVALHCRRMFWLAVFGLAHAYLLWYGDILFTYAICGMLVFPVHKLQSKWLLTLGIIIFSISTFLFLFFGWSMPYWPSEVLAQSIESWLPSNAAIVTEISNYQGSWLQQMASRIPRAVFIQTNMFAMKVAWKTIGLMLIGMALFKWGVFSALRSRSFYKKMIFTAVVLGFPLVIFGVIANFRAGWSFKYSMFYGSQFNYWGGVLVSLGYAAMVMLLIQSGRLTKLTPRFAAVGRTALSNYLLQTIICTSLFYGHGLGLFGQVNRVEQILIILAIWVFQLWAAPLYLKHFRYGPFEWFWRCLNYMRIQPFRK